MSGNTKNVIPFDELGMDDVPEVGGKNASLGEMVVNLADAGVRVPGGFATTADAYRDFLALDGLDKRISEALADLDIEDVSELTERGGQIRQWIIDQPFPEALEQDIRDNYADLVDNDTHPEEVTWAVRSSATAEDLPDASFAGQQETYLNIGGIDYILEAVKWVFASLYNDRAIAYRVHHGFHHDDVALSAGVQRMVRTDIGASGVMFTVDTESGFDRAVFVTASYGLGEAVVQGAVNPDEFYVSKPAVRDGKTGKDAVLSRTVGGKAVAMRYAEGTGIESATRWEDIREDDRAKFSITDEEVTELARHAVAIEEHYGRPMDIEWGRDGLDGQLYILQARPETVVFRRGAGEDGGQVLTRFEIDRAATLSPSRTTTVARWTSSGASTARTGSSTSSRPVRRPLSRAGRGSRCPASSSRRTPPPARRSSSRDAPSASGSVPAPCGCCVPSRTWTRCRPVTFSSPRSPTPTGNR